MCNLYSSPYIIMEIWTRRIIWTHHIECIGDMRNVCQCHCHVQYLTLPHFQRIYVIFMLWLCPASWWQSMTIYLILSEIYSKTTSFIVTNRVSGIFCRMFSPSTLAQLTQMCPTKFPSLLALLDLPKAVLQSRV